MTFGGQLLLCVSLAAGVLALERAPRWRLGALSTALAGSAALAATSTRSAWIGLLVAVAVLAWQERRKVSARLLLGACLAGLALVVALAAVGLATGRLDDLAAARHKAVIPRGLIRQR